MSGAPQVASRPIGGRYWPIRQLAVGGMAEITLARQGGDGARPSTGPLRRGEFEKQLVVKRLKPALAREKRLVDMFLDEARVSALFNHPHVVHVHDVGEDDGIPFIAMEYIRGEELNELCRRGLSVGAFLPLEHAVELVRQAALGLGYVHALRDESGRGLEIVHCDVSPTNLLVTEDGFLQLIDFGIARSRGQRGRDEHAVPGKLSYMSPEQARRQEVDHRSDIFSLGVVLYEITLGKRLFKGPAQEVVERLSRCDVKPPTFVRRDYPGMLESIVMRALEARPADRYASAFDMADELDDFLREGGLRSGPLRVARYLDQLAVAAGGERRDELVSEREAHGDEDALDFDRGMFEGYQARSPESAARVADWDEVDEDEQAVADALGVDVALVKAPARPSPSPSTSTSTSLATATSTVTADKEPEEASIHRMRTQPKAVVAPARGRIVLWLLLGIAMGAGGALLLRFLLGG
jgi:serine/threonine-protein kinase